MESSTLLPATAPAPLASAGGIPVHCTFHEIVPIHGLRPHPANPNKHPERQLAIYARAIQAHGWREAVTVSRRSGYIISGHGAVEAARRVPADSVPVEYQDYDSDELELADLLAHNRLASLAVTDKELLRAALEQLQGAGGVVSGYGPADLAKLLQTVAPLPQYPIVARLNERHDFLVIRVDSETDWQFLKNLAGVRTERSYKNETVGDGRVITFQHFIRALSENRDSIPSARRDDLDAPVVS